MSLLTALYTQLLLPNYTLRLLSCVFVHVSFTLRDSLHLVSCVLGGPIWWGIARGSPDWNDRQSSYAVYHRVGFLGVTLAVGFVVASHTWSYSFGYLCIGLCLKGVYPFLLGGTTISTIVNWVYWFHGKSVVLPVGFMVVSKKCGFLLLRQIRFLDRVRHEPAVLYSLLWFHFGGGLSGSLGFFVRCVGVAITLGHAYTNCVCVWVGFLLL